MAKAAAAKEPEKKGKKTAAKPAKKDAQPTNAEPRSTRKVREGIVVSNKMQKTVVVEIERRITHPLYSKVVLRSNKFKAHDEAQTCDVGDRVEIMETRPISRDKRWRVVRILEKVK